MRIDVRQSADPRSLNFGPIEGIRWPHSSSGRMYVTRAFRIAGTVVGLSLCLGCQPPVAHQHTCSISTARSTLAWQYLPGAGGIRGRVVDVEQQPIVGALVNVGPTSRPLAADGAGRFQLALREGRYLVQVRAVGYVAVQDTISLPGLDGFQVLAVLVHANPGLLGCSR